jgi:hypothetical protein
MLESETQNIEGLKDYAIMSAVYDGLRSNVYHAKHKQSNVSVFIKVCKNTSTLLM